MSETGSNREKLGAQLHGVATELAALSRRIDELGQVLTGLAARPGADHALYPPGYPPPYPPAGATPYSPPYPPTQAGPGYPPAQPGPAYPPPAGPVPPPPAGPVGPSGFDRLRTRVGAMAPGALLAAIGGAVTLLGVVLLLVLAASRGWFSATARVTTGAVLGLVLIGIAVWLHGRARTGAIAVAATGVAALFLSITAATSLYHLLPGWLGLLFGLVVAGIGLGIADRWESRWLAIGVLAAGGLLGPLVTEGFTPLLVAFVLALQVTAVPVVLRWGWPAVAGLAAGWPALYGVVMAGQAGGSRIAPVGTVLVVVALGLGAVALFSATGPGTAGSATAPANSATAGSRVGRARSGPVGELVLLVAIAPLPLLMLAPLLERRQGAGLAGVAVVVLLGFAVWPVPPQAVRYTAVVAGALAALETVLVAFEGGTRHAVLLGIGMLALITAAVLRARLSLAIGAAFGVIGLLATLAEDVPIWALIGFPTPPFRSGPPALVTAAGLSVLVIALAIAGLIASGRVADLRPDARSAPIWVPLALVALYGATGLVIALALLASPSRNGFLTGHVIVTVSWTIAALILLAFGIRRAALRVAGMVLVAAAVLKLVLFDLVALDGIARVAAFLGAGLVLLAAGTWYARKISTAGEADEHAAEPPGAGNADSHE